jgi:hypothetical protein
MPGEWRFICAIDKFSNHSDWIFELEYDGFLPTSTFAGCVVSVAKCPP